MEEIQEDKEIILDSNNEINTSSIDSSNITNTTDDLSQTDTNIVPETTCLALAVRKEHNLIMVKNIFTTSGRLSWRIVLATIVLNFLNMIF